ncbi:MAG: trigger factor [Tidjanibacter sp.]|nr:trigger factor [Tidjanibacter sp.]
MNIVRENRENQLAIVKVTVAEPDYIEEVNKKLHEYKRKANMPGFRPGMVPMSIINKLYRKGAIAEAAYKAASDACFKYIEDEKIDYMGDVMPSDEQGGFDFDNNTEHEFVFELGLAPEINVELSADDKITRYKIKADDDMRDSFRQNFLNRFGMMKDVESIEKDEALTVTLDNGEMKVEEAYVGLVSMTDEQKAPFIGKKKGDQMIVDINELYKNKAQRSAILKLKDAELDAVKPEFNLTIDSIRKFALPDLNEDFFKIAFPEGDVTDEAGFEKFIDERLAEELAKESENIFGGDVKKYLMEKVNPTLPEEFLKRWLVAINEGKYTAEQVEHDFPAFAEMMKWSVIQKYFITKLDIKIDNDDMLAEAKKLAGMQLAQYGIQSPAEDMLTDFANRMLGSKEEANRILQMVYDNKIVAAVTPMMKVSSKSVTIEQLKKIFEKNAAK